MQTDHIQIGNVEIELVHRGSAFLGLGQITIDGVVVRGNALPMRPFTATHDGIEYNHYTLEAIETAGKRVILRTRALGIGGHVAALQDHSLDPVWSTRAWDGKVLAEDRMDWILEATTKKIGGHTFVGFTYSYHFHSRKQEIYYILDRATWEMDGEALGVTLLRQQMGADPCVTLRTRTAYSTSACIGYPLNPIMTHDVPRWASEQGFDYQYRGRTALVGVFDHCGLIRTIVTRDPGDDAIRHFDKHLFDQSRDGRTVKKFIGIAGVGNATDHLNAWTAVFDADQDNVLGQFGMHRTAPRTTLSHNFWHSFTAESYRDDLLPAAAALGFQQIFIDPYWENDMTRKREGVLPEYSGGNMCCPHEYEVANVLGGPAAYRALADDARATGVELISWIGSHQSQMSPYLLSHPNQIIRGADGRHWYGSGYDSIYGMDLASPFGAMFRDKITAATHATTISGYLYDSFYNFAWMPTSFYTPDPSDPDNIHSGKLKVHTQWKELCEIMAAWQRAGLHMLIESLGPWGQPQHGVQGAYNLPGCEPLAYQCSISIGYSVIPVPGSAAAHVAGPDFYYRLLANKAPSTLGLWMSNGKSAPTRIDRIASPIIRQANLDYRAVLPLLHTRTLLQGEAGVLWRPAAGKRQVLFSYQSNLYRVPKGTPYLDQTTGVRGVAEKKGFQTEAYHTYIIG